MTTTETMRLPTGEIVQVERQSTTWRNPTRNPMTIDIFLEHGSDGTKKARRALFRIQPGQELAIPSIFDDAIHLVRDGVIVGGHAPLALRVDPPQVASLHPCLVPTREDRSFRPIAPADVAAAVEERALAGVADEDEALLTTAKAKRAKK